MNIEERRVRAERITEARKESRLTQQQLADRVGVSLRTVKGWERDGIGGQESNLLKAEIVLGIVPPPIDLNAVAPDIYAVLVALAAFMDAVDLDRRRIITEVLVEALASADVPEATGEAVEDSPDDPAPTEPPVSKRRASGRRPKRGDHDS